jgi:hypothetical protein
LDTEEYLKAKGALTHIHRLADELATKFYGNDFDYTQYK